MTNEKINISVSSVFSITALSEGDIPAWDERSAAILRFESLSLLFFDLSRQNWHIRRSNARLPRNCYW